MARTMRQAEGLRQVPDRVWFCSDRPVHG